jgi:hypothetical protein
MALQQENTMVDPAAILISCRTAAEIERTMVAVKPRLPPELRDEFDLVRMSYRQRYGADGLYERVNNRTVAAILAEFDPADRLKLLDSGEVEGVRYKLYDAPDAAG